MSFFGKFILLFCKSRNVAATTRVTALHGVKVQNVDYAHTSYPIYEIGGKQLVPIEVLQASDRNFDAVLYYRRQCRELYRMLSKVKR